MTPEDQLHPHEKWKLLIEEQEKSGLFQSEFCKQKGITVAQLGYYRGIIKGKNSSPAKPKPTFSAVTIQKPESKKIEEIQIILPNGFKCLFPALLESTQIKKVIEVLLSC